MDTIQSIPDQYLLRGSNTSGADKIWWHYIDWGAVNHTVKSLQIRIAKAVTAGQWRKVKSLQWLASHNNAAKLLAVRRVTENQGKHTAGIDGQTWPSAPAKQRAVEQLQSKGYQAKAVRRIYIPKPNGKKRPLGIPTMHDRAMQALYLIGLEPVSETTGDANSYGFRPQRGCADAIQRCFDLLSKKRSPGWILEGDIKGCFDNISHEWIMENIPLAKKPLKQWLKSGYREGQKLFPNTTGTPQGSIISPTIANLVLDGLEAHLDQVCGIKKYGVRQYRHNPHIIHFIRYADDFIVTCREENYLKNIVLPAIQDFLKPRGLTLSDDKTLITHIDQGFDFLGQNVRKYDGKLLIKPSKKNVHTFLQKVRGVIKNMPNARTIDLIRKLNPMIRGWAMYHRHVVSKRTFSNVDHAIFKMTWRWAKRRHAGKKNMMWIKNRYFTRIKGKDWLFFGTDEETQNQVTLFQAASISIQRHTKIDSKANIYEPNDEPYFELRTQRKMTAKWHGRQLLRYIFKRQNGRCPYCNELIDLKTGWHVHHIIQRIHGGKDTADNLVMLHPNCHTSVHLNGFSFTQKNTAASS
jgi:RNA-directed DNA polymerase